MNQSIHALRVMEVFVCNEVKIIMIIMQIMQTITRRPEQKGALFGSPLPWI